MSFFQFKHFSFINNAIKRIVEHIKANSKKQCFFVNLKNPTFWVKDPRGEEILSFFKAMTDNQKMEFFGFFDIFIICFGQNGIPFLSMTANPSNPKFEITVFISISKGYNIFKDNCAKLQSKCFTEDLRGSIGHSCSPFETFGEGDESTSLFGSSFPSVERESDPVPVQYSQFEQDPTDYWNFGAAGPTGFSFLGGNANSSTFSFQPILEGNATGSFFGSKPTQIGRTPTFSLFSPKPKIGSGNPITENLDFVSVPSTSGSFSRKVIRKGRVLNIEIPSECSSGPSTSSTIEKKKSPRTPTPIITTMENLHKRIQKLENKKLSGMNPELLTLETLRAKMIKLKNSL